MLYDREAAVEYANKWAYGRNPRFYDFSQLGGDCTNFASQCIYAGSGIMNYTPVSDNKQRGRTVWEACRTGGYRKRRYNSAEFRNG